MKRTGIIAAAALTALLGACARRSFDQVRTPISTIEKEKEVQFNIDSHPQGAGAFIDSASIGTTPVSVKAGYKCSEVTYKVDTVLRTRRAGADIGGGVAMMAGGLLAGMIAGIGFMEGSDESIEAAYGFILVAAGLEAAGIALLIRGIVFKARNGKVRSSKQEAVEECPPRTWKLVLAKEGHLPVERVLYASDAMKRYFVALTPVLTMSTPAPPAPALDKAALLSSMAAEKEVLKESKEAAPEETKTAVKNRMKNLGSLVAVGDGYEAAGEDIFISADAGDIKMFEMTTEKYYCYTIAIVAPQGSKIYLAVFRGKQEIVKDFAGADVASVRFCSDSNEPVRVTTTSETSTTLGLRIYFLPK